ncbi:MAG: ParB/RepB/Spo0J family partition protein [Dehalococcoidia bacterium]
MARKDFAAMERNLPSGASAARAAMRSRMAHPTRLRLEELQPNPLNPRYDADDPEVEELAATLNRVGQLQPALVITREQYAAAYPDEPLGPEPWVVIVGNRRLAASRLAGRAMLDVRVVEEMPGSDGVDAIEDRVLIENVHRQDLPPLLEAEMLQRRLNRSGESLRTVAAAIGKTHTYVAQRIALLKLVPELQEMLRTGRLGIRQARELGGLQVDEQQSIAGRLRDMSDEEARGFLAGNSRTFPSGSDGASSGQAPAAGGNRVSRDGGVGDREQDDTNHDKANRNDARREDTQQRPSGNQVSTDASSGAATGRAEKPGISADLEATRLSVQQWLDNAAADLDRVLPSGGDAGVGGQLAEARGFIEKARAVLQRATDTA